VSEALDLVLMGPPGAGKGTQAQRIAGERGLAHIATGDMLRAAVREGTPLGLRAKGIMARGDLVPDDVIIDMIRERLGRPDTAAGFLLDGFPRTAPQAEALDQMLAGVGRRIARVLVFDLDEELLVERISGRRVCRAAEHVYHIHHKPPRDDSTCDLDGSELYQREDDKPEVVRARYQKQWVEAAASVVAYYRSRGLVDDVDAAASPEVVGGEVDRLLDRLEAA
jgi:adenylate kinase